MPTNFGNASLDHVKSFIFRRVQERLKRAFLSAKKHLMDIDLGIFKDLLEILRGQLGVSIRNLNYSIKIWRQMLVDC